MHNFYALDTTNNQQLYATYLGCYVDVSSSMSTRILGGSRTDDLTHFTRGSCIQMCYNQNYLFAGAEYG